MKPTNDNNQNFWISYADLMAGLLFVFILLIGAIVIKYVYVQNNLSSKEEKLAKEEIIVSKMTNKLMTTEEALKSIRILLQEEKEKSSTANETLESQLKQIENLEETLSQKEKDLLSLNEDFLKMQMGLQEENKKLKTDLNSSQNTVELTKAELVQITQKLYESTVAHQKLVEDLNITKARIKNLTGIRIKAIKVLKKKLGKNMRVDPVSGALKLPSSILFDVDSFTIKDKSKNSLRQTLVKYINTLLNDKYMRNYIDSIVIEGYTDSSGSYLYNLELSQKRAFAVLEFLYKQKGIDKKLLQKYVSASGQAFNNVVIKNGEEDKEASRRIEIKFRISNKKAIQEIETFLKNDY